MSNSAVTLPLVRRQVFVVAFFLVLLFLLYQTGKLLAPFVTAFVWAAIIALITYPLYGGLRRLLRGRANLAAALMTLAALVVIVVPSVMLLAALTSQAVKLGQALVAFVQSGGWAELREYLQASALGRVLEHPLFTTLDIRDVLIKGLRKLSSSTALELGRLLRDVLVVGLNILIMLFALFFFYRDGEDYYRGVMEVLPFAENQKQSIAERLRLTFSAIVNGIFLVAVLQGIMTGLGFVIFGVPYAIAWGFLAILLALLPIGGAAAVWISGVVWLYFQGENIAAIGLAVWGTLLVSLPDNFLKPMLIGNRAKLPTFFLFIGLLGGLMAYGFLGLLFGPLTVALLATFIQIFHEEYGERRLSREPLGQADM